MTEATLKKHVVGIYKEFLEKVVAKYPTWNSFIEGMKEELRIAMFLDTPLAEDVIFETERFEYRYFNTEEDTGSRNLVQEIQDSILSKSQALTILACQMYLFKKLTHGTQIKYDDYNVGLLGTQDSAPPCVVYYEESKNGKIAVMAVKVYGNVYDGAGPAHYRFDRYWYNDDASDKNWSVHLTKGTTVFCK